MEEVGIEDLLVTGSMDVLLAIILQKTTVSLDDAPLAAG